MKDEIMQKLVVTLNALNSISVNGKQNLANLSGSIAVLEEITNVLSECDIVARDKAVSDGK